jgi:hypothetical protein
MAMPIQHALFNFLTAAFLTLLTHAVRAFLLCTFPRTLAFLLCTFLRTLAWLYFAILETFHHRSRVPRGYARTLFPSPVAAYVDILSL